MLEVKVLGGEADTLRFTVRDITIPFANALRRVMIAEVPTMAIDDVIIVENTSSMFDEALAHRLGFIPLVTDLDSYVMPEACTCHSELGCGKCRVTLTMDVEAKDEVRTVYSGDLTPDPSNPSIRPVSDRILVTKLAPGQRIKLEAYAALGIGQKHAKWQPVSTCTYRYRPRIQVSRKNGERCKQAVDACHAKVYAWEKDALQVVNPLACDLCMDCVQACPGQINILEDRSTLIFRIDSLGSLPPRRIVAEATRVLEAKVDGFIQSLEALGAEPHEAKEEQPSAA